MKKDASKLMTEEQFWNIIDNSDKGENLYELLKNFDKDQLYGYTYWWDYFNAISYKQDLWAVAYVVMGGCSDDSLDYFRFWLVAQGKEIFYKALEDADTLCDVFDELEEGDAPVREDFAYVVPDIMSEKYGEDSFYTEEANYDNLCPKRPKINFEWEEDNEDSIRKVCPKTFDKWWNNDRF